MKPFFLVNHNFSQYHAKEYDVITRLYGKDSISHRIFDIPPGSVVIPRYRAIPLGLELEDDVKAHGSTLLNSYHEHRNIADIYSWAFLLEGDTPPVYTVDDIPYLEENAYIIKGETNSKKNQWFDSFYAPTKSDVIRVVHNVLSDAYLGNQKIAIRPFEQFRQLGTTIDNRPIFHERRVFVLRGEVVSWGFYWSTYTQEYGNTLSVSEKRFEAFLELVVPKIQHLAPFITVDVAEYPDGSWAVVELNDGVMSGMSENDPYKVWSAFKNYVG